MPRRDTHPPERAPLSKLQGQKALLSMRQRGEKFAANRRVTENDLDTWTTSTLDYLQRIFGEESPHLINFCQELGAMCMSFGGPTDARIEEKERFEKLTRRLASLVSIIDQLETDIQIENPAAAAVTSDDVIWALLHPKVVMIARTRFEGGHFADSVESALKELNTVVKEMVRKKTGKEFDGASLMRQAFTPNGPIITLDDLSTDTGKNIQQGYMDLFAGSMIGIRNPKAHNNLIITKERAIHHLFLASLLFHKLDERL